MTALTKIKNVVTATIQIEMLLIEKETSNNEKFSFVEKNKIIASKKAKSAVHTDVSFRLTQSSSSIREIRKLPRRGISMVNSRTLLADTKLLPAFFCDQ
jgi:hypothetical protein